MFSRKCLGFLSILLLLGLALRGAEASGLLGAELEFLRLAEEAQRRQINRERVMRDRTQPFEMTDVAFKKNFRLPKYLVLNICEHLTPFLNLGERISALPVGLKVLIALRFYATGSYQLAVGNDRNLCVSQSTVSKYLGEVSNAIVERYLHTEIKFPTTPVEQQTVQIRFYEKTNFPGTIGAIDCTHVAITPPSQANPDYREYQYMNRKGYHSINVQLVCDYDLIILNVNAKFPGASHDSHIFKMSRVSDYLENGYRNGTLRDVFLIGDSGYALTPWLMTPILNPPANSPEERYSRAQCKARSVIERCNGVLKQRFRCLLKDRVLHYAPDVASTIINACCILHNICRRNGVPDDHEVNVLGPDDLIPPPEENNAVDNWLRPGRLARERLVRRF